MNNERALVPRAVGARATFLRVGSDEHGAHVSGVKVDKFLTRRVSIVPKERKRMQFARADERMVVGIPRASCVTGEFDGQICGRFITVDLCRACHRFVDGNLNSKDARGQRSGKEARVAVASALDGRLCERYCLP